MTTETTEIVHTIRYEQRALTGSAWVAAYDAAVPGKTPGKVLQDTGDYFAIRFPKRGVYIYKRAEKRGWQDFGPLWDRGVLVMVLP